MRASKFAVVAAVMCLGSLNSFAQQAIEGTGAGNGGDGSYGEYQERLKRELGVKRCPTGQTCGAPDLTAWCAQITRVLKREVDRAQLQVQYNRFAYARQIIVGALRAASNSLDLTPALGSPMTKTLVDRGLVLDMALDDAMPDTLRPTLLTKVKFLSDYVHMILRAEAELDRPYYIPYMYRYGRCTVDSCPSEFSFRDFESRYIEYAKRQLEFVATQFTQSVMRDGAPLVTPVGPPRAFLVAAELVTGFVAQDLRDTLYAYSFACVVADLENLSATIRSYNWTGDRTVFPNDMWAVAGVGQELDRLTTQMNSCSGRY